MNERQRINKQHPQYAEYIEKCEKLASEYFEIEDKLKAQYPNWRGLDHPADGEIMPYWKKFHEDLKRLQAEYSFLFVESNV